MTARRLVRALGWAIAAYLLVAYVVLPALWTHYEHAPVMETVPKVTTTGSGIPGDPYCSFPVDTRLDCPGQT